MSGILVACVGNIFKRDDGFGSAVALRLAGQQLPDGVRLVDFGIRSVHLAYELLEGYDVLVLVDTVSRQQGPPGTVYLIEPDPGDRTAPRPDADGLPDVLFDAHDLPPGAVLDLVPQLGGWVAAIWVVGVQPVCVEDGMGLSEPVEAAVEEAAAMVLEVVRREAARLPAGNRALSRSRSAVKE